MHLPRHNGIENLIFSEILCHIAFPKGYYPWDSTLYHLMLHCYTHTWVRHLTFAHLQSMQKSKNKKMHFHCHSCTVSLLEFGGKSWCYHFRAFEIHRRISLCRFNLKNFDLVFAVIKLFVHRKNYLWKSVTCLWRNPTSGTDPSKMCNEINKCIYLIFVSDSEASSWAAKMASMSHSFQWCSYRQVTGHTSAMSMPKGDDQPWNWNSGLDSVRHINQALILPMKAPDSVE